MNKLFLSFWNIHLDNLPEGTFRRRTITAVDAKLRVERARQDGGLLCVSEDDLFAPYKKHEHDNHLAFCRLLSEKFEIPLSLEDFSSKDDDAHFINALNFAKVDATSSLLVVTCAYVLAEPRKADGRLAFDICQDTVKFYLIESVALGDEGQMPVHLSEE